MKTIPETHQFFRPSTRAERVVIAEYEDVIEALAREFVKKRYSSQWKVGNTTRLRTDGWHKEQAKMNSL